MESEGLLGLSHYYRQTEGSDSLSHTFQSTELLTPLQTSQCPTVSQDRYQQYLQNVSKIPRVPWGREREYGGLGSVSLPEEHRPKAEPPTLVAKGHHHSGYGGDPWPRGVPIEQYYDITQLKRSNLRWNDQLLPNPPDAAMNEKQIYRPFPAEHPYQSHISRFAVFPNFKSPDDPGTGVWASDNQPFHPNIPAKSYDVRVLSKTKGSPFRHEVQYLPFESQKNALSWPGQFGYFHFPKSAQGTDQEYYPQPPKTVTPNPTLRSPEATLSEKTVNMLRNVEKSLWLTSYKQSFTGTGPMNPLQLDNYHEKILCRVTGDPNLFSADPKEHFQSSFFPARPLEGRIARLLHGQRPLEPRVVNGECSFPDEGKYSSILSDTYMHAPLPNYSEQDLKPHDINAVALKNQNLQDLISDPEKDADGWKQTTSRRAMNVAPSSDLLVLRNKTGQLQTKYHPHTFHQHLEEMESCSHEPEKANSETQVLKITDTSKTDDLYKRQLKIRPRSAEPDILEHHRVSDCIYYEDLPHKRLDQQNSWPYPFSRSKSLAPVTVSLEDHLNKESEMQVPKQHCGYQEEQQHYPLHSEYGKTRPSSTPLIMSTEVPRAPLTLRELQDSFSKSEAHKQFHESVDGEAKDLRDNIHTGKKHNFFGFNAYYFHN